MSNLPVGAAVKYFQQAMELPAPDEPSREVLSWDRWGLRQTLIDEEYDELIRAYEENDHAAFLDACVDLVYVVIGTAIEAGLPFDEAFEAVHRANMAKLHDCPDCGGTGHEKQQGMKWYAGPKCEGCAGRGQKVRKRDDGKVLKPVGWQAPDIASIIWKENDASRTAPPAVQ
jgi:predicted HAD superfamily Cof-like phosphohydrolase